MLTKNDALLALGRLLESGADAGCVERARKAILANIHYWDAPHFIGSLPDNGGVQAVWKRSDGSVIVEFQRDGDVAILPRIGGELFWVKM